MIFNKTLMTCTLGAALAFNGCTRSDPEPAPENNAPTAFINQSGTVITAISSDLDGDALTYTWTVNGELQPHNSQNIIIPDVSGRVDIILQVSDGTAVVTETLSFDYDAGVAPVAEIYALTTQGIEGDILSFSGVESSDDVEIVQYKWLINDAVQHYGEYFNHKFEDAGTYVVKLIVEDDNELTDADTVEVTIGSANIAPVAHIFTTTAITGPAPLTVGFDGSDSSSDTVTWEWTVIGQPKQYGETANFTFTTGGSYSVTLKVFDAEGLTHEVSQTIEVDNEIGAPVAVANSNVTIDSIAPVTIDFDAYGTTYEGNESDLSYEWSFADEVKEGVTVSKLFTVGGSYTAQLTVEDLNGKVSVDTLRFNINDQNMAPTANAQASIYEGVAPLSVTFNGSGVDDYDAATDLTYSWVIDGAAPLVGDEVIKTFTTTGRKEVILTVTDSQGLFTTDTIYINVGQAPNAVATATPENGVAPLSVTFDGSGSTDNDVLPSTAYSWNINGTIYNSVSVDLDFDSADIVTAVLTVTDANGLTSEDTVTVNVLEGPTADADASVNSGTAPLSVTFDASGSTDDKALPATAYSWVINNTTYNTVSVDLDFDSAQTVTAELTVTDSDNLTSTDSVQVVVTDPANEVPTATATADVLTGPASLDVVFTATGNDPDGELTDASYSWSIDGGASIGGQTLSHTFDTPKTYTVVLTVTDSDGATATDSIEIVVTGDIVRPVGDVLPEYDGEIPLIKMKGLPNAPLQTLDNPFSDSYFYASPDVYHAINETSLDFEASSDDPNSMYQKMKYTQRMPSAVWMDSIATISGNESRRSLVEHLDAALAQQEDYRVNTDGGAIAPMLVVIIIYNLPDRDCAALASSGLLVEVGDDTKLDDPEYAADVRTGLDRYKTEYIDVIASAFNDPKYDDLRIVAMLEPDSYPNMLTNQNPAVATDEYCIKLHDYGLSDVADPTGESGVYVQGLRYAIEQFADDANSNVYTYLDIGHSGWLGWDGNRDLAVNGGITQYWNTDTESEDAGGAAIGFTKLIEDAHPDGLSAVRGFASNTSGYTPLFEYNIEGGEASDNYFEWNKYVDELHFMEVLNTEYKAAGFAEGKLGFIIDTARNGWGKTDGTGTEAQYNRPALLGAPDADAAMANRVDKRTHRGRWCNVMDAGVGESPQANPLTAHPWIDAFYWMKPPGESDGSSNPADENAVGKSYDPVCGGVGTPKTGMVPGRVIGNAAGVDTRTDTQDTFYAPTAGLWFDEQYRMLINNAYPALGAYGDYSGYDYSTAVSAE